MLFAEDLQALLPFPQAPEMTEAVLQNEHAPLEIEVTDHLGHEVRVGRVAGLFEHIQELLPPSGERVIIVGIHGEVWREIRKLRRRTGIGMRANHDRDRGCIEMKERVDLRCAGYDGDGAALQQKLRLSHPHLPDAKVHCHGFGFLESERRMNARPGEHMERAGEHVLVNVRRPFEPKQNLNVEARIIKNDELRLTKSRLRLVRLLVIEQELADERADIHVLCRRPLSQRFPCDVRELRKRKIRPLPTSEHRAPEVCKKLIHARICCESRTDGKGIMTHDSNPLRTQHPRGANRKRREHFFGIAAY